MKFLFLLALMTSTTYAQSCWTDSRCCTPRGCRGWPPPEPAPEKKQYRCENVIDRADVMTIYTVNGTVVERKRVSR